MHKFSGDICGKVVKVLDERKNKTVGHWIFLPRSYAYLSPSRYRMRETLFGDDDWFGAQKLRRTSV